MSWTKGQSGNPLGRSKSAVALATIARKSCKKALALCVEVMDDIEHKVETRLQAAQMILDRGLGKPPQGVTAQTLSDEELVKELITRREVRIALEQRARAGDTTGQPRLPG